MDLANKPVNPVIDWEDYSAEPDKAGITYKEALVLHLAGNPALFTDIDSNIITDNEPLIAQDILTQADEIIRQMELK